ncbi:MAG: 3-hydroxyacyl-CoA dehydrogenase / enoyl-CoA hydratase / 3-hydroxybutyryl-CoA epimerase [Gammaproteobacteria bacterium]|nr:3-hydroxyacyl-CoA dehydrogenase / enoyl-CoA hydratase / 3-hydroxybutyryl-CoA epimerase [Gammaproteobacteria bacterium]
MSEAPPVSSWKVERDADSVVWLTIDKPGTSANVLSSSVLRELDEVLAPLAQNPPRAVIVISGKKSGFIAGADIKEFTAITNTEDGFQLIHAGQEVLNRLEALPCPTVAAIHGFALGGGLELALACRYRVAVNDERLSLGLPEVQLGIHPGFGGTVRSVRLVGVRPAMEMMLTGKPVRADKALRIGLVDKLVPAQDLRTAAKDIALKAPTPFRAPFGERVLNWPIVRNFVKGTLEAQVASKARRAHYPAPYAMIDLWARGGNSYEAEARSIAQLFISPTSRSLVRVYLLQDRLKALGGKGGPEVKHVHVVGAGVMGGDIAAWSAMRGFTVTLQDRGLEFIEPALKRARELFDKRLRDPAKSAAARERLRADVEGDGARDADVVIEAIFESLEAKQELYARLEPRMKPDAILATNTSSLMLEPLTAKLARPQRLVGLHFFNPVAQMPLIEIVQSASTDPAVMQAAISFARKLDKLPVPCRSAPGFVVNRVLMPYLHEAMYAAQEGVPLSLIDEVAVDFGMPMGPIELADVVGLDVATHVGEIIAAELGRAAPDLTRLRALVAAKKLGRKSGEGFYVWQDGKPVKPVANGASAPQDLIDRLILVLVNECVACLREKVVEEADLVDAAVIFGTGFAPFRGGPLAYARTRGVNEVVARLGELAARHGPRFTADSGWPLLSGTDGKP